MVASATDNLFFLLYFRLEIVRKKNTKFVLSSGNISSKTIIITLEGAEKVVVSRILKQLEDAEKLKLGRNKITLS